MCIGVFHFKFEPKRTISVEMRAKSVWQVKFMIFLHHFFKFFIISLFKKDLKKVILSERPCSSNCVQVLAFTPCPHMSLIVLFKSGPHTFFLTWHGNTEDRAR